MRRAGICANITVMEWELDCEEQALSCERRAADLGERAKQDWLEMASDWRLAATEPEPPFRPHPAALNRRSLR